MKKNFKLSIFGFPDQYHKKHPLQKDNCTSPLEKNNKTEEVNMTTYINSNITIETILFVYSLNSSSNEWLSVFIGKEENSEIHNVFVALSYFDYSERGRMITEIDSIPVETAVSENSFISVGCANISAVLKTNTSRSMEINISDFSGFPAKESANKSEEINIPTYF